MNEIKQVAGVKKSYGDDILDAQKEVLEPLQNYFGRFGACIVQGCEVTINTPGTPNTYDIASGIVALLFGSEPKLVRFDGVTNVQLPQYLEVTETIVNGAYVNVASAEVARLYEAVAVNGSAPSNSAEYLEFTDADKRMPHFEDVLGATALSDEVTVTASSAFAPGSLKVRYNAVSRCLHVRGQFTVIASGWGHGGKPWVFGIPGDELPEFMRPQSTTRFTAYVDYDTTNAAAWFKDLSNSDYIKDIACELRTDGVFYMRFLVPQSGISTYVVYVNAVIPID